MTKQWYAFSPIAGSAEANYKYPDLFFNQLPPMFADATHLYVECSSFVLRAEELLARHSEDAPFLPGSQTAGGKCFRCNFSENLIAEVAELADSVPAPELCDHVYVYSSSDPLLVWTDAFLDLEGLYVSGAIPPALIKTFSKALSLEAKLLSD